MRQTIDVSFKLTEFGYVVQYLIVHHHHHHHHHHQSIFNKIEISQNARIPSFVERPQYESKRNEGGQCEFFWANRLGWFLSPCFSLVPAFCDEVESIWSINVWWLQWVKNLRPCGGFHSHEGWLGVPDNYESWMINGWWLGVGPWLNGNHHRNGTLVANQRSWFQLVTLVAISPGLMLPVSKTKSKRTRLTTFLAKGLGLESQSLRPMVLQVLVISILKQSQSLEVPNLDPLMLKGKRAICTHQESNVQCHDDVCWPIAGLRCSRLVPSTQGMFLNPLSGDGLHPSLPPVSIATLVTLCRHVPSCSGAPGWKIQLSHCHSLGLLGFDINSDWLVVWLPFISIHYFPIYWE